MSKGLFRAEAVASYQNPETRGGLAKAPRPSGVFAAAIVTAIFAATLGALAFVRVDVTIETRGRLQVGEGSLLARSPVSGVVSHVDVEPGDEVLAGVPLAVVGDAEVQSPGAGTVDFVDVRPGELVVAGATIAEIAAGDGPRSGLMIIAAGERGQVEPGMSVRVHVPTASGGELVTVGKVERISGQALSRERATKLFGSELEQPSFLVTVQLDDERFRRLPSGTPLVGSVAVARQTVLGLLVPAQLRRGG